MDICRNQIKTHDPGMFGIDETPALEKLRMLREKRPRADLNRDRWIQSPECWPLHHEA